MMWWMSLGAMALASADFDWAPVAGEPLALTAADGTGLRLSKMDVDAVVDGPLAFTEMHLTFENPEDRQIEGRFQITLPEGAAISRFAMKIGDVWQEGEVVELQAARRAYEDFLHRRTDPALLEFDAGNTFRARVFPIEARASKELIISWSHDLDEGEAWALPTGGLPELGLLDVSVHHENKVANFVSEYAVPEGDLRMPLPETGPVAYAADGAAVLRFVPDLDVDRDPVKNAVVLIDTSASRALALPELVADVTALLPTFGGKTTVKAFDQDVVSLGTGSGATWARSVADKLRERGAYGASNLAMALSSVEGAERVVLFTDAVGTAGELEELTQVATELGIGRLDVVLRGGGRDGAVAASLANAGARNGVVLDADQQSREELIRRIGLGTAGAMAVEVEGSAWTWPRTVTGLQPGDTVTVYAGLRAGAEPVVRLGGERLGRMRVGESNGPLLQRAAAGAQIASLLAMKSSVPAAERASVIERIVELSVEHRVLSPHTALLVLETEEDYARYGIARNGLADILHIEGGELAWIDRKEPVLFGGGEPVDEPVDEERVEELANKSSVEKKEMAMTEEVEEEAPADLGYVEDAAPRPSAPARARRPRARPSPAPRPMSAPPRRVEARVAAEAAASERNRAEQARVLQSAAAGAAERSARIEAEEDRAFEETRREQAKVRAVSDALQGFEGDYRTFQSHLLAGDVKLALSFAKEWQARSPGDPLALLALGEALEVTGDTNRAARVYGSLIDLFSSRADLRRLAGQRLEVLEAFELATDTYEKAVAQRADHPSGHRNLAYALVRTGQHEKAAEALIVALEQPFGRFREAHRILREDLGLILAAWKAKDANAPVDAFAKRGKTSIPVSSDLRMVLQWETDNNDVDFHIYDAKGGHAYYSDKRLPSGGDLYADVTTGYGPECFRIEKPNAFPYRMQAHYYSRGPMGFGMGKLQIIRHDGKGGLSFDERPFVVMKDGAYVPLGTVER